METHLPDKFKRSERLQTPEPYQRHHTEQIQRHLTTSTSCLSQPRVAVITGSIRSNPETETHFLFCSIKTNCSKFAGELV